MKHHEGNRVEIIISIPIERIATARNREDLMQIFMKEFNSRYSGQSFQYIKEIYTDYKEESGEYHCHFVIGDKPKELKAPPATPLVDKLLNNLEKSQPLSSLHKFPRLRGPDREPFA